MFVRFGQSRSGDSNASELHGQFVNRPNRHRNRNIPLSVISDCRVERHLECITEPEQV